MRTPALAESVNFIGPDKVNRKDNIDFFELPERVPLKVESTVEEKKLSALDALFNYSTNKAFAVFPKCLTPPLKNIFKENILSPSFIKDAVAELDKVHYADDAPNPLDNLSEENELNELEKIFSMLFLLEDLNNLLADVRTRMRSILKP